MVFVCVAAPRLPAVPIAIESFDSAGYTQGVALNGLNGGVGWNGAWTGSAGDTISAIGMPYAQGASLLLASGGKLQCVGGTGGRLVATGAGSLAKAAGVVNANNHIGADGTSVWVAFLGQCPVAGADFGIDFTRPGAPYPLPQTGVMSLSGEERHWRYWPQANSTGVLATRQVLLVWRIDFAPVHDTCTVWINPTPGTVPSDASCNFVSANNGDWSFDRIQFSGGAATTLLLDELRIGTTYADVAPVDPSPPGAPGTPLPEDASVAVASSTLLDWSDCLAAASYDVYVWSGSGTPPAVPTATVTDSQYDPPGYLLPFTEYHWKVVARNPFGTSDGSVWSFTTGNGHPPAPATPTPAIAASNVLVDTALDWTASLGADSYEVSIWLAGENPPATPTATVAANHYVPSLPLAGNTIYNWKIVAVNVYGSTASEVWTFTTGDRYPGYLVPWPKTVTMGTGDFPVTAATRIVAEDASLLALAQVMSKDFFMASGITLTAMTGPPQSGDIALRFDPGLSGEAYTLTVNSSNIVLAGQNYQAVAWASVTLLQALNTTGTPATVPQMVIADQPAAPLRSVMWDIGRFFHPLETLYEFVDLHRMYKVTYMHLFMTADGLFTFGTDIPALQALKKTSNGVSSAGFYLPPSGSRLYYTKAELTALVEYAKNRGVIIVPEIDTPSWAAFMTQTLPAVFSSTGGTTVTHDININYSTAVAAVEELIGEMAAVFASSPYIHIGADEVSAAEFESYPYYATSKVLNNYASGGEGLVWYLHRLDAKLESLGKSSWAWSTPGVVDKGYDMRTNLVYTAWGYDDGQYASQGGYSVMRAAGGHVAGYGQQSKTAPYNRCLLYRPAEGIYNRLTPLFRYIGAPDNIYTELTPTFLPLTGRENKILGAHIMEWETPYEVEVPAFRLSMPALGEPTWNQETSSRRNWDNFLVRQKQTDALYQRVMRPVNLSVTTQVDPKDACFVAGGMVTMSSPVAGTIRYTVGTDYVNSWYNFPTSTSTAYTGSFPITQSSVISARLFDASGNPLGNPVTRGFYLITPKTHYQYFYTGNTPPTGFEKGTPIVSSVMGQMNGNAPNEDVRFGDTKHRTIYSGALNVSAAGAYTFSASYGGAISIDRVPLTNGTPVTLSAGEHLFKIVTPASDLGTPYTFSGPSHSAGTDLNVLLKTLSTCSQVFPASYAFGTQSLGLGATAKKEITIVNHSPFNPLTITSLALAGTHPGEFLIDEDSGESVLAPGAERIVAVRFNPATTGSKTATLHVVSSSLPGGVSDSILTGTAVAGTSPATPTTPAPDDTATGVMVNPTLNWADAEAATSYAVYLWLESGSKPDTATATVAASQWTPSFNLTAGAGYKWQVVAINTSGSTEGPLWTFHTGSTTVQVTNLTDGEVLRYPMVLVDGTFDGGSNLTITAEPTSAAISFTQTGTRFRCLVDLQSGSNTLTISDGQGSIALNLVYTPPTATGYRYKVWYVVPSDEANSPADSNYYTHFGLQTKLMQSWMAEDQERAGNGRLTFYPELDESNNIDVGKLVVTQTRAQAEALSDGMFGEVWNQIPSQYKDGLHKNIVFSSVAFHALSSGDLAYVGAYQNIFPNNATEMMTRLLSADSYGSDSLTFATYSGVTLHEIIHGLHSIWHDTSPNNIMGGGGYDISQYFTLTYSASNPSAHNESAAGTLGNQRELAAWNRYVMSADPHVYQNATIAVAEGVANLAAASTNPLAVFQYYIPNAAADQYVDLAASNVTSYSKNAAAARAELGASVFNLMVVDTEGNMNYGTFSGTVPLADSYTVQGSSFTSAAPGVLANDINPGARTLSATMGSTVQHGELVLNSNGGFTYTPTTGYVGTDTFTYTVHDGVASGQSALVTLVTQSQTPDAFRLISVDFVYSVSGSTPYVGDATLTGTLNKNALGEIYTGQQGPWNALVVGGNNSNTSSASLGNLLDGTGSATTVSFKMGRATTSGAAGGDWRTNYVTEFGNLRQEQAYIYVAAGTSSFFDWELAGLTPGHAYRLTLFSLPSGNAVTHVANTVPGIQDAEGDWDWSSITADSNGRIKGTYLVDNQTSGIYGLQLESITPPVDYTYTTWASAHAGGQTWDLDYDHDGIPNGVEYFMGEAGTTVTANLGIAGGSVTWSRDPNAIASFKVQVSDNLDDWFDIVPPHLNIDTSISTQVKYTLPSADSRKFYRLAVMP